MFCDRISCIQRPLGCHVSCKGKTPWEHSPTRRKRRRIACIKRRGAVRICVTAPIYLPRPTNLWTLHMPTLLPRGTPHGCPRGPAWTRVASCHVSAPYAPPAPRVGHPRLCHVALVSRRIYMVVPRAMSARLLVLLTTSATAGKSTPFL